MIPVPLICFEIFCAIYGETIARHIWHPVPLGCL